MCRPESQWPPASGRDQVAHEDQGLARRDRAAGTPVSVGHVWRDDQLAAAADLHPLDALIPAGDDPAGAELECERISPVPAGVELLAGGERDPDVVDLDRVAGLRDGAVSLPDLGDLQAGRRLALGEVDLRPLDAHAPASVVCGVIPEASRGGRPRVRVPRAPGRNLPGNLVTNKSGS